MSIFSLLGRAAGRTRTTNKARRRARPAVRVDALEGRCLMTVASPTIQAVAYPNMLWPPNGAAETVVVAGRVVDTGGGINPNSVAFHVVDEYGADQPYGHVTLNAQGQFAFGVPLIADRYGFDRDGHQYFIVLTADDAKPGNPSVEVLNVNVPHDMGNGRFGVGSPYPSAPAYRALTGPQYNLPTLPVRNRGPRGLGRGHDNIAVVMPPVGGPFAFVGMGPGHGHGHGNGNGNGHGNGNGNGHGNGHGHGHGH